MSYDFDSKSVTLWDRTFEKYIDASEIKKRVHELGTCLQEEYASRMPLFMCVLNGAGFFAVDLIRACAMPCEVCYVKISSYDGTSTLGNIEIQLPPPEDLEKRNIILVEDIVDTGNTLQKFLPFLERQEPKEVAVVSLLVKEEALEHDVPIAYRGFNISDDFVVGYGMDYKQRGRELSHIYKLVNHEE